MRKIITIILALCLILAMAVPASAITTGKWDFEAGKQSAQDAAQDMIEGRTITYDYNGGWYIEVTGWRCKIATEATYTAHGTHTIPDTVPWRYNCTFAGWVAPDGTIYQPSDQLQGGEDITLVAQWRAK